MPVDRPRCGTVPAARAVWRAVPAPGLRRSGHARPSAAARRGGQSVTVPALCYDQSGSRSRASLPPPLRVSYGAFASFPGFGGGIPPDPPAAPGPLAEFLGAAGGGLSVSRFSFTYHGQGPCHNGGGPLARNLLSTGAGFGPPEQLSCQKCGMVPATCVWHGTCCASRFRAMWCSVF